MKYIYLILVFFTGCVKSFGQSNIPDVKVEVRITKDSAEVVNSFRDFLAQSVKPANLNKYILKADLPATVAFLDEIKGMSISRERDVVYKCHINNFLNINGTESLIQFSYQAVDKSGIRAMFNVLTKKIDGQYYFYTLLHRNTLAWKVYRYASFNFYYQDNLDKNKAKNYAKTALFFDKKLNAKNYHTEFYACNDLPASLNIIGISYNEDYKGIAHSNLSAYGDNMALYINGADQLKPEFLDQHDLWHYRLHNVVLTEIINRPVDEGCAYLYGGSWGVSRDEIFKMFKAYMNADKDYFKAFNENKNFGTDAQKPMYVSYMINALIIKKLEVDKGFPAVIELLSCGKKQKDNANYFNALYKLTGINSLNFNERVGSLVIKGL